MISIINAASSEPFEKENPLKPACSVGALASRGSCSWACTGEAHQSKVAKATHCKTVFIEIEILGVIKRGNYAVGGRQLSPACGHINRAVGVRFIAELLFD